MAFYLNSKATHPETSVSVYPHKWLKFVMFTIYGAHGKLSTEPRELPSKMMSGSATFPIIILRFRGQNQPLFLRLQGRSSATTRRAFDFRQKIWSREELLCRDRRRYRRL